MRIISGINKGRRINPPAKMPHTRPTTDIAREGLFNILNNNLDFSNLKCLDLFGGTGAISYELASRGVPDITVVEMDKNMHSFIKSTSELCFQLCIINKFYPVTMPFFQKFFLLSPGI